MRYRAVFSRSLAGSIFIVSTLFGLAACQKESVIADGAITATILPAGYATQVTATDAAGHAYTATPDAASGAVQFNNIPAGTYTVVVATKVAYEAPEPQKVQITPGKTTVLQYSTLTRDTRLRGTLSWVENGARYTAANLYGEVSKSLVSVDGFVRINGIDREVAFVIPVRPIQGQTIPLFTGIGTYGIGMHELSFGKYTRINRSNSDTYIWITPGLGTSTGHVTVTQYDPVAFTIAGTFDFTAQPFYNPTGASGDIIITEGSFTLTY